MNILIMLYVYLLNTVLNELSIPEVRECIYVNSKLKASRKSFCIYRKMVTSFIRITHRLILSEDKGGF